MDKIKHTPTPWVFSENTLNIIVSETDPRIICKLDLHGASWKDQCRADAEYICRAVNSHEELLGFVKSYLRTIEKLEEEGIDGKSQRALKGLIQEALKKAADGEEVK